MMWLLEVEVSERESSARPSGSFLRRDDELRLWHFSLLQVCLPLLSPLFKGQQPAASQLTSYL